MDTIIMSISERDFVFSAKGRRRRRPWSEEEKRQILTEAAAPGASVSTVARRHDLNANLLFTWRRQLAAEADGCPQTSPAFMPAVMIDPGEPAAPPTPAASGIMEIVLVSGHRVIVGMDVDAAALARVIKIVGRP
jgi:transposase